jgi:Leucine-rich repeat (LRR) protein
MKKLEKLNLSKCAFSDIPPPVVQVKTLKTLIMNCNKITRLKKEFNNLDSLECIDLSNNQLISDDCLRDIFSKMIQLARVNLSYNHIARFPNFFFCESIRYIDISYNEL